MHNRLKITIWFILLLSARQVHGQWVLDTLKTQIFPINDHVLLFGHNSLYVTHWWDDNSSDLLLTLRRYDTDGHLMWKFPVPDPYIIYSAEIADSGQVVLLANKSDSLPFLLHVGPGGNLLRVDPIQVPSFYISHSNRLQTGDYVVTGRGFPDNKLRLIRMDQHGHVLWNAQVDTTSIQTQSMELDPEPNLYGETLLKFPISSSSTQNRLTLFDSTGNLMWRKTFGIEFADAGVHALEDGNFIIWGLFGFDSIQKINRNGDILWKKPISAVPGPSFKFFDYHFFSCFPLHDNGFILAGYYDNVQASDPYVLIRFDANGEMVSLVERRVPNLPPGYAVPTFFDRSETGDVYIGGTFSDDYRPYLAKTDPFGVIFNNAITGTILNDLNVNCQSDSLDKPLRGWLFDIKDVQKGNHTYVLSDPAGHFQYSLDSSKYQVKLSPINGYWKACQDSLTLDFAANPDTVSTSFAVQPIVHCPFLEVDIATPGLRRCFESYYIVRYANTGTADAEGTFIRVTLDPHLHVVSAEKPFTNEGNHVYRFDIGAIPQWQTGRFWIQVYMNCDSVELGQTHCVMAHIYPDTFCMLPAGWSGANVDVSGACHPDSVRFAIRNTGTASSASLHYIVIEDNIIYDEGNFQLDPGDSLRINTPANGSTWRVEAQQEPGNPGNQMPSATVEGCGQNEQGAISIGYVSQFGQNDGDPFISIDCRANVGSFDPNEKTGFPTGYGPEHAIEPGQDIEYQINFQNTGTDSAQFVVVRDTLSKDLDPTSIEEGVSSHPYKFEIYGPGIIKWTFDKINLPDSTANEPASHGFVRFRIRQRPNLPPGTVIRNHAGIYFDYNDPVITNETWHTVRHHFVPVSAVTNPWLPVQPLTVFPNPAGPNDLIRLSGTDIPSGRLELFDVTGKKVLDRPCLANQIKLQSSLPGGIYWFKAWENNSLKGMGKIILH
jgi:uncharacterized repeat protein (TIGR01451 family)